MEKLPLTYDYVMTVKWGDCDAAGISYYAKNFEWFTDARFQFLSHFGFSYIETFHNKGINLVCLKAESDYRKMVRPLETITIRTKLSLLTRTRMTFTYQVLKEDGELAAVGETALTCVSSEGQPFNLEKKFPELWNALLTKLCP